VKSPVLEGVLATLTHHADRLREELEQTERLRATVEAQLSDAPTLFPEESLMS
jgi:hypothetical protein